ncbi:MAG: dihydroneopterin aldolase [Armatimonadetes bacterium]|nr:dihydroneopterin aldolase [Armatimonadota bacterium]
MPSCAACDERLGGRGVAGGVTRAVDRIILSGMWFHAYHGVDPAEAEAGQPFVVDVEIDADLRAAGAYDDLARTVDYRQCYAAVRAVVEGQRRQLIEAVAEAIAGHLLALDGVAAVVVRVRKPQVVLGGPLEHAAVEIRRERP